MSAQQDEHPIDVRVVGGDPTAEELAAATAVLRASLDELAGLHRKARRAPTAWERGRRILREPLTRGGWNGWAS
ncbi:acyl-CoA carboxylase epsilon subunit [Protaetiibacter larvae]|uniref:Acyl-CoA carboxylase subunit epsilon n=1 Tax=Protaetiibacter larvae TaxID=2592654 RepID=A0A5C1Y5H2_9MICO|nr:acyl-CoA carboxylase epsilon subunit [Protaetiibacter larvae]QEO08648.1 acyl-CoA carboxylase subunit epsilon [Protaetiibacter larvae]